ncbi:hypothetical protein N7333_00340 [Pseudomonas sp. GD04158]|uniref:hypothetical protein n=1 Tax=Pseudomonas sp. GD04158 TaxID=2975439 RepID=UPI002449EC44|nr:hypothetical protein [Pseudomonas sp. GD04158]MDH0095024.1 hypothetical protein [Pseudomonas sp. GD04158]
MQSVELQIKNLLLAAQVTNHPVSGPKRAAEISKSTLGGLNSKLFESFLVTAPPISEPREEESNQVIFSASHSVVMHPGDRDRHQADLCNLIEDRNHLVHSFLTQYDLGCDGCCEAALVRLNELNGRAISVFHSLKVVRQSQREIRDKVKDLVQSEIFFNLLVGQPLPPGQDWLMIEEVQSLIEAGKLYADESGKVSLQKGVEYIVHKGGSEDAYTHYGCKSWQDLAAKTGLFSVERQKNPCSGRWEHFYRLGAKIPL